MFDYQRDNKDYSHLIGANVRRGDMIFMGKIISVDIAIDGYNNENAIATVHLHKGLDNPLFDDEGNPVTIEKSARAFFTDDDLVDTETVTYWADDDMPLSFKEEVAEKIHFKGDIKGGNRFAYKPVMVKDGKVQKRAASKNKSADFMSGVSEVVTLKIGD